MTKDFLPLSAPLDVNAVEAEHGLLHGSTTFPLLPAADIHPSDSLTRISANPSPSPNPRIHLPLASAHAYGAASREITTEARFPTTTPSPLRYSHFNDFETPSSSLSDPFTINDGDTSYPSLATLYSGGPRGILRRMPLVPANTPTRTYSSANAVSKSNDIHPPPRSSNRILAERCIPNDLEFSLGVEFDPLPLPKYNEVRGWLSKQLKQTKLNGSPSTSSNMDEFGPRKDPHTPLTPRSPNRENTPSTPDLATPTRIFSSIDINDLSYLSLDDNLNKSDIGVSDDEEVVAHGVPHDGPDKSSLTSTHLGFQDPDWTRQTNSLIVEESRELGEKQEKLARPVLKRDPSWRRVCPSPEAWKAAESKGKLPLKYGSPLPPHFRASPDRTASPFARFYGEVGEAEGSESQ